MASITTEEAVGAIERMVGTGAGCHRPCEDMWEWRSDHGLYVYLWSDDQNGGVCLHLFPDTPDAPLDESAPTGVDVKLCKKLMKFANAYGINLHVEVEPKYHIQLESAFSAC